MLLWMIAACTVEAPAPVVLKSTPRTDVSLQGPGLTMKVVAGTNLGRPNPATLSVISASEEAASAITFGGGERRVMGDLRKAGGVSLVDAPADQPWAFETATWTLPWPADTHAVVIRADSDRLPVEFHRYPPWESPYPGAALAYAGIAGPFDNRQVAIDTLKLSEVAGADPMRVDFEFRGKPWVRELRWLDDRHLVVAQGPVDQGEADLQRMLDAGKALHAEARPKGGTP